MAEHTVLVTPTIVYAAELYKDNAKRTIRTCLWSDGMVSSCIAELDEDGKTKQELCCHTTEDGGEELYYAWQEHLTSPEVGYQVREVTAEEV